MKRNESIIFWAHVPVDIFGINASLGSGRTRETDPAIFITKLSSVLECSEDCKIHTIKVHPDWMHSTLGVDVLDLLFEDSNVVLPVVCPAPPNIVLPGKVMCMLHLIMQEQ